MEGYRKEVLLERVEEGHGKIKLLKTVEDFSNIFEAKLTENQRALHHMELAYSLNGRIFGFLEIRPILHSII